MNREQVSFDVVIVGAGPSGLAAAIRMKQLSKANNRHFSVCVVEKEAEIGASVLAGSVFDPYALEELFPNWREMNAPLRTKAKAGKFVWLVSENKSLKLPSPPSLKNEDDYVIRLGEMCAWLAREAKNLGVIIYQNCLATEVLYHEDGGVRGVACEDVEIFAKQTVLAEGGEGFLSKEIIQNFGLNEGRDRKASSLAVQELWEIAPQAHNAGEVLHTMGWPLNRKAYGGASVYHLEGGKLFMSFVVDLENLNTSGLNISPDDAIKSLKKHPLIQPLLRGGKRLGVGSYALAMGGIQSLPRLSFKGGLLVGDSAGTFNLESMKGVHTAMKSGSLAGEALFQHLKAYGKGEEVAAFEVNFKSSWAYKELYAARNIRPGFDRGFYLGLLNAAFEAFIGLPRTLHRKKSEK